MPDIPDNQPGKYKIVFCGELQKDQDLYSVKSRLSSILKIPLSLVENIFTGKPVLLRTDLSLTEAQSFKSGIEKTGILCRLLKVTEKAEAPSSASAPVTPEKPAPVNDLFPYQPPKAARNQGEQSGKIISMAIGLFLVIIVLFNLISRTRGDYEKPKTAAASTTSQAPTASRSTSSSGLLSGMQTDFTDPKQNYSVYLPRGFRVTDKSAGNRSKIVFNYSGGENVTILASPMNKSWDSQATMDQKVQEIRQGRAPQFSRFEITHYGLVSIGGTEGYEIVLESGTTIAHAYALVSLNNTAFSISIVTSGKNRQQNHDLLDSNIRRTFRAY